MWCIIGMPLARNATIVWYPADHCSIHLHGLAAARTCCCRHVIIHRLPHLDRKKQITIWYPSTTFWHLSCSSIIAKTKSHFDTATADDWAYSDPCQALILVSSDRVNCQSVHLIILRVRLATRTNKFAAPINCRSHTVSSSRKHSQLPLKFGAAVPIHACILFSTDWYPYTFYFAALLHTSEKAVPAQILQLYRKLMHWPALPHSPLHFQQLPWTGCRSMQSVRHTTRWLLSLQKMSTRQVFGAMWHQGFLLGRE